MRLDPVFGDVERSRIRQRTFQTVADLNENFAGLGEDKKDDAVTFVFLADTPCLCDPLRVIGDIGVALHCRKHSDDYFSRGITFELRELFTETKPSSV